MSAVKLPHPVVEGVFAFPPNRDIMGGTAYLIQDPDGNILVDSPAWDETYQTFLQQQGGVRWLVLTHRGGIGQVKAMQAELGCEVVIQEQEVYLLPGVPVTPFQSELSLNPRAQMLWTPGYSPGSSCLYYRRPGQAGILFTGRHLLPNPQGQPVPLRITKTFHWKRQLSSIRKLLDQFSPETLDYLCPGANTGFLRGERAIAQAYAKLSRLDLAALEQVKPEL